MEKHMEITPLERWISRRIGNGAGSERLTREQIQSYRILKLRETIRWARTRSAFYKERLAGIREDELEGLDDLARFPFTTAEDLRTNPLRFLCVSQSEVSRVVTLQTSGTTGPPKRVYFTEEDQQLTVDFFHHGMSTLVAPGDRVLILLPGERPGSVGDLLATGLSRLGATGIPQCPVRDVARTLEIMAAKRIDALVGIPTQVLALARHGSGNRGVAPRSVLLSTDHVPDAITRELGRAWGCEVYNHYGMTEMGLGGAVECRAHRGYHMRELDLYFEIVHPESGLPLEDGEVGEVVFTTLTRRGMPLIRYRTGDLSRFIPGRCPCGTVLETMAHVKGRINNQAELAPDTVLTMADLDETLFAIDGLLDFEVEINLVDGMAWLRIQVQAAERDRSVLRSIRRVLDGHPVLVAARRAGTFKDFEVVLGEGRACPTNGVAKRTIIIDRRRSPPPSHGSSAH
jgi:phenylacetate-coenzyme A ligase PaaK-like adenylate-forming protein